MGDAKQHSPRRSRPVGWLAAVALLLCALGLGLVIQGHYHRLAIEDQFPMLTEDGGFPDYPWDRPDTDQFSSDLYRRVRSLDQAVILVRQQTSGGGPEVRLRAAYDLVRHRFVHYMYPVHTWRTNFILALLGRALPGSTYDAMYLGDDLLRHAAGASCGQAAGVFIELWRALGGRAQAWHLPGHDVAEAQAGGRLWMVDPDVEALIPHSVEELVADPSLMIPYYRHMQPHQVRDMMERFAEKRHIAYGWDAPPTTSPRIYRGQQVMQVVKFAFFPALALVVLGGLGWRWRRGAGR